MQCVRDRKNLRQDLRCRLDTAVYHRICGTTAGPGWKAGAPNCHSRKLQELANRASYSGCCVTNIMASFVVNVQQDRFSAGGSRLQPEARLALVAGTSSKIMLMLRLYLAA